MSEPDRSRGVPGTGQELNLQQLREHQLHLLRAVADHCDTHGLRYYLCAGTLLGAVRHQGYIPWDDDIDLMLPRPDFEALCRSFPSSQAAEGVSLRIPLETTGYVLPFAKACDDRTRLEVESDIVHGLGVFIDVFPLDGWHGNRVARVAQRIAIGVLLDVLKVKHLVRGRKRAPGRNVVLGLAKVGVSWLSARRVSGWLSRVAQLGAFDESAQVGVLVWGQHESVPVAAYGEPRTVDFEGLRLPGPADAATVLRILYGDYLRLPPLDQQVTSHRFVAYALGPSDADPRTG